jgi:UPF0716 protein FxsA
MMVTLPFLVLPILEIAVFAAVAWTIGFWPTVAAILALSLAGAALLRWQGIAAVRRVILELAAGNFPVDEVLEGLWLVAAGVLLVAPGFITDLAGLLLFIPPLRRWLVVRFSDYLRQKGAVAALRGKGWEWVGGGTARPQPAQPDPPPPAGPQTIIDVDFVDLPPK